MLPVLVVEDHSINRDVAVLQLKALGLPVEAVSSGVDAIEKIKTNRYSLILMDVMMPDLDGCETCAAIREYEKVLGRYTPVIAVSAWSADDNRDLCQAAGMDDYISKPYSREQLKAVVERWMKADASI